MGHTQMLLAVAGLSQEQVKERSARLARGEWSTFTPGEQAAFAFAQKQASEPWKLNDEDVRQLVDRLGPERTLDVIWWSSRCHFMTRVADAFQLPLEQENVFQRPAPPPTAEPPGAESPKP
jgi:alkylhydroperoxidase family enzyme